MRGGRRGQASLEYLVTYGWAFLVILVAIGALAYFGVISPSKWIPDKCDLGSQLACEDFEAVTGASPEIKLFVRNGFGKEIEILQLRLVTDAGEIGQLQPQLGPPLQGRCYQGSCQISPGTTIEAHLQDDGSNQLGAYLKQGEKQQFTIRVEFQRTGSGNPHWLTGILYTTVK